MGLTVFWHHIGREHGGLDYTDDIRKNSPETIDRYLRLKEEWVKNNSGSRKFHRYDENTIVEFSPIDNFIIIYFIDKGLQLSLNTKSESKYPWWKMDVVNIIEIRPEVFCAQDLFIDVKVYKNGHYAVIDIDDFETAIQLGIITMPLISKALKSLHMALSELNNLSIWPIPLIERAESIRKNMTDNYFTKV